MKQKANKFKDLETQTQRQKAFDVYKQSNNTTINID